MKTIITTKIKTIKPKKKVKKTYITKGFLSSGENPTQNAVVMFSVYLSNLPENWNINVPHQPSVDLVREHFETDYGFDKMIMWGISFRCSNSKSSYRRHISMNKAYIMAKSNLSIGMTITNKKLAA